ncbi:MAG: flippase [candidate division Zixibacteria bacterium]|nr:flippase [candidate division Zixibacteria bacterium]
MSPTTTQKAASTGLTRKILENSVALFTSQLLAKVFRVLANFLLARFLGPENFGVWALVLAFIELFRFLPNFGLDLTLVRNMSRSSSTSGLSKTLFLRSLLSGLALVTVGLVLTFTGYSTDIRKLIYFYSLSFFLQSGTGVLACFFQVQLRSAALIWAYTISGLAYLGLILVGIFTRQELTFFMVSLLSSEGVLLLLFALTFFKKGGRLTAFNFSELTPLLKEAFPIALYLALVTAYFRIDTLVVYHYGGERGAGLYSACFRLSEAFLMLASSVAASLFPVFSRLKTENKPELASLFNKSFFWFFPFTLSVAILGTGLSPLIISFLFGEAFAPAAGGLAVIIWSVVFMFANSLSMQALFAFDREKTITQIAAVTLLVNLGLNFWLVPRFGFVGACWATLGREIVSFVLQARVLQKILVPGLLNRVWPHFIAPALALLWFYFYPASFKSAGIWIFTFGYLVFLLNRKGRPE